MSGDVPAVATAVRILEMLAEAAPTAVTPGRLVEELELNRSTCFNVLGTLQRAGWAASLGNRAGWTLGPRLLALTQRADAIVAELVQDELCRLSAELGFVAFLAERANDGGYVIVARADQRAGIRITVGVGDTFPFSAPALMHAFCAWLPPGEFDKLVERYGVERYTEETVVDLAALHELMATVRTQGYSVSVRQFQRGQGAVVSPVFDGRGRVVRAVGCLAFSSELDEERIRSAGQAIRACAERITLRTGGVMPRPARQRRRAG